MSRTTDAINWVTPFHEAAQGRTGDAVSLAGASFAAAPDDVRSLVIREGLRVLLHAARRSSGIRVNGDADTVPLFVAMEGEDGIVVHKPRFAVPVAEIVRQLDRWSKRMDEAGREVAWWSHQRDLAVAASASDTETLRDVWTRLGLDYRLFLAADDEIAS